MTFSLTIKTGAEIEVDRQAELSKKVNGERMRRVAAGTTIAVTGVGDIPLQGRPEDLHNMSGLYNVAQFNSSATITFRDRDNIVHSLTSAQFTELYFGAMAWVEAVYAASWALKAATIPDDYNDDSYWP